MKVKMYSLQTIYMDRWSGPETGPTLYFRTALEAHAYCLSFNARYNTASSAPDEYTTHEHQNFVWVDEDSLELVESDFGMHCRVKRTAQELT